MNYTSVLLRGEQFDVAYRVLEDDPSGNVFETEWHITNPPLWIGDITSAEEDLINLAICESAYERDDGDDLDRG